MKVNDIEFVNKLFLKKIHYMCLSFKNAFFFFFLFRIAFNHFRLDGSLEEDTLSKILQGFKKHKECETELETSLKSLNNSIDVLWKNSLEKYKQSPLLQPPSHTGIPSRSETMQLLTVQLSSLVGDDM
jgi:hypothetical protein